MIVAISLMTVCYQEQDENGTIIDVPMCSKELLMMGRKAARNM
jgi:hypothetical protein